MALDQTTGRSPASRKFRGLAIAVAIVVALYSAGWFTVASKFETFLNSALSGNSGYNITCPGLSTGGFPFLIGFTCSSVTVGEVDNQVVTGAFKLAARIYAPGSAIVEIDGPATASLQDGSALDAKWSLLRASFSVGFDRLKSFSADGKDLDATITWGEYFRSFLVKARDGQMHMRENGTDLDAAFLTRDFELAEVGEPLSIPKLSSSAELTLKDQAYLLAGKPMTSKVMQGELKSFKIETPDGLYGELTGPFTINEEGYLSGTFVTKLEKLDLWQTTLVKIFPEADSTISGMSALLKGLAKGEDKVTVNLVVIDGTITLSLLPIGHIPPI